MISSDKEKQASENPFGRPICDFFGKITNIRWTFPLIPQLIQFAVLCFVLVVLVFLYGTIGIIFHCYAMFETLLIESNKGIKSSDEMISKSAYALASGIYLVLAAPFWIVLLPFRVIGWMASSCFWWVFVLLLAVLAGAKCFIYIRGAHDSIVRWILQL